MKASFIAVVPVLALIFSAPGCSSDEEKGSAGSGGSAGSAGSGGKGGTGGGTGPCVGQETAVAADYDVTLPDGGTQKQKLAAIARTCGIGCLSSTVATCVNDCIQDDVKGGITAECTQCTVGSVQCGSANCLGDCTSGDQAACDGCLCGNNAAKINCIDAYETCAGIASSVCG